MTDRFDEFVEGLKAKGTFPNADGFWELLAVFADWLEERCDPLAPVVRWMFESRARPFWWDGVGWIWQNGAENCASGLTAELLEAMGVTGGRREYRTWREAVEDLARGLRVLEPEFKMDPMTTHRLGQPVLPPEPPSVTGVTR